jgi:hypothetical protein
MNLCIELIHWCTVQIEIETSLRRLQDEAEGRGTTEQQRQNGDGPQQ